MGMIVSRGVSRVCVCVWCHLRLGIAALACVTKESCIFLPAVPLSQNPLLDRIHAVKQPENVCNPEQEKTDSQMCRETRLTFYNHIHRVISLLLYSENTHVQWSYDLLKSLISLFAFLSTVVHQSCVLHFKGHFDKSICWIYQCKCKTSVCLKELVCVWVWECVLLNSLIFDFSTDNRKEERKGVIL